MSPTDFANLLQESHKTNNVVLMNNLKSSIREQLVIFKNQIETMVEDAVLEMNAKVLQLEEQIQDQDTKIEILRKELVSSKAETSQLKEKMNGFTEKLGELTEKSSNFDFQCRKRNVVLYKVAETERNNFELFKTVHSLIKNTADVHFKESDIDHVYRIGKKGRFPRPVLLALTRGHKRNQLLNRSRSFINKRLRIEEDLPKNILQARKPIYKLSEHLRKEGKRAVFRKEKFIVDGIEWNSERIYESLRSLNNNSNQ